MALDQLDRPLELALAQSVCDARVVIGRDHLEPTRGLGGVAANVRDEEGPEFSRPLGSPLGLTLGGELAFAIRCAAWHGSVGVTLGRTLLRAGLRPHLPRLKNKKSATSVGRRSDHSVTRPLHVTRSRWLGSFMHSGTRRASLEAFAQSRRDSHF